MRRRNRLHSAHLACGLLLLGPLIPASVPAGVINPDISVIGQPFLGYTDGPQDPDRKRFRLDIGETEFVFAAALNPYARGTFIVTAGDEGFEIEEGFFLLTRGLPGNVALKGGKYRVGFGRLNPLHPHAYPFAERFNVLAAYLPGDEAFNETGISLSRRFPIAGEFSINVEADWLQGDSFHPAGEDAETEAAEDEGLTRPAFLGRVSGFTMLGEQSALEFGVSGTGGTNDVARSLRTRVYGIDAKAKLWSSPQAYLHLQAEALQLRREVADLCPACANPELLPGTVDRVGGYVFADYNFSTRYNLGASYERYEEVDPPDPSGYFGEANESTSQSFGAFAGYSLLEESTAFRLDWRRSVPGEGDAFNTIHLRVLYSMGPHRAHTF